MKYMTLILAVLMVLTLVSCNTEQTPDTSESITSTVSEISDVSSDASNEESSEESSEASTEEPLESWTETQTENNITITTEYSNYGNDWVRTTKTFAEEGYLEEESVYEIVNKEIVKKFDCQYDENGKVLYSSTEEIKDGGKTVEKTSEDRILMVDEEDGICLYTTELYELDEQGEEQFIESELTYRSDKDDSVVLYNLKYNEVIDGVNFEVDEYICYKDGEEHHYIHRALTQSADEHYYVIYDIDMNPIYEYHHTDNMAVVSEVYYRQEGYLQATVEGNVLTYYESKDGTEPTWYFQMETDSETGEVIKAFYNGDYCDRDTANDLYAEFQALYNDTLAFSADIDYNPQ